jgi:hypothetical protein
MLLSVIFMALVLFEPSDPITDRMRFEIAAGQRDYLIAKQQLDQAAANLRAKLDAAEKACGEAGKTYNIESFSCKEKP